LGTSSCEKIEVSQSLTIDEYVGFTNIFSLNSLLGECLFWQPLKDWRSEAE
jgi:hypothetical protein